MSEPTLTEAQAIKVFEVLRDCGAYPSQREEFIRTQISGCREYRFMGLLGYGGKFWNNSGRWYVTCYSEDRNTERDAMIESANARLEEERRRWTPLGGYDD